MMFATIRREIKERGEYRFGRWGSFWYRFSLAHWKWAVALCHFEDHWALHLFCFWVTLWKSRSNPKGDILDTWGFGFYPDERCLHLNWGAKYKILYMPWSWDHCSVEVLCKDGTFGPRPEGFYSPRLLGLDPGEAPAPAGVWCQLLSYSYRLPSGEVQVVTAAVTVERRAWVWKWCRWLGWPRMVRTSIDVAFSDEVGERRGSWKGGTIGCGWDLRPDETPEQCLRRMESERVFN